MKILLLEDDEAVRDSLVQGFKHLGHEVQAAPGLAEARRLLTASVPDCAVLDLCLQDGLGSEFLGELLAADPHLPVVFITGHPDHEALRSPAVAGVVYSVLEKPVSLQRLRTMVEWAVERRRQSEAPSREAQEAALPPPDELKEMLRKTSWGGLIAYLGAIALVVLLLVGLLTAVYAFQHRGEADFGLGSFMEKIEGYLKRDELRELQLQRERERLRSGGS